MNSYFDGSLLSLIVIKTICFILTVITFGIAFPYCTVALYRWEISHSVIDGRRLRFDGTAMGLFGQWIKWLFLIIITLGIYSFWVAIALKKWKVAHTHFI
jgi:uncharacterized membrane protein YjgN (DUF898 family)